MRGTGADRFVVGVQAAGDGQHLWVASDLARGAPGAARSLGMLRTGGTHEAQADRLVAHPRLRGAAAPRDEPPTLPRAGWTCRAQLVAATLVALEAQGLAVCVSELGGRTWRLTEAGRRQLVPRRGPAPARGRRITAR